MSNLNEERIRRIMKLCDEMLSASSGEATYGSVEIMGRTYKTVRVGSLEVLASENLHIPELAFRYKSGDKECYYTWHHLPAIQAILDELGGGWRVMTNDDHVMLDSLGSSWHNVGDGVGRFYGENHKDATIDAPKGCVFFPASGYRDALDGALGNRSSYGYGWSSTQYSAAFGYYLDFGSGASCPANYNSKAYGFPVRCVREVK